MTTRTALTGGTSDPVYRASEPAAAAAVTPVSAVPPVDPDPDAQEDEMAGNEPILTADELRALLAEQPTSFPDDAAH